MNPTSARARVLAAAVAAASALGVAAGIEGVGAAAAVPIGPECPALYVLGVDGTGLSSPTADPLADTGVVGALIGPVLSAVPGLVQRSYIPYSAGFGGAVPGGGLEPYAVSVAQARSGLDAAAAEIAQQCPATRIAGVGYSQGAQAVGEFARAVGAGAGPVEPDQIAGIALYAHPGRAPGSPTIPGRPGQVVPDAVPGTGGQAVGAVELTNPPASGGGLAARADDYGALEGRVADICTDGDLACSAPERALGFQVAAEIAAQADLRDPLTALSSLNAIFHAALGDTWTTVLEHDFAIADGNVDYLPQQPVSQRLLDAADPRVPTPSPEEIDAAAARWNLITATVAANPWLVGKLVGQFGSVWGQLSADNADLINPAVWLRYADTITRHNSYPSSGQLASGTAWMIALAHDLAGSSR
ncbi:cutinase family protein [Nocardia sp. NPDC057227]|uniref:cutinase family protein n=1 Tax=Nocardia sp. NPDC057227 TaxID=3346056 RepID=UPI003645F4D2